MLPFLDGNGYLIYLAGIAALLQACLQMPVGALLHMAGHSLGKDRRGNVFALGLAASLGVALMVCALLIGAAWIMRAVFDIDHQFLLAGLLCTLAGLFVMLRYFREDAGAQLWLPRPFIRWFYKQIERNDNLFGAFVTGGIAASAEIGLSFPLLISAGALLLGGDMFTLLFGLGLYTSIVVLPLLITTVSLAAGAKPLRLQRWRAEGKRFWQFFIGLAFIIFGLYVASQQFTLPGGTP